MLLVYYTYDEAYWWFNQKWCVYTADTKTENEMDKKWVV